MFVSQSNNWSTVKYFQSKESSRENLIKCFIVQTKAKHFPKFSHNYPPPPPPLSHLTISYLSQQLFISLTLKSSLPRTNHRTIHHQPSIQSSMPPIIGFTSIMVSSTHRFLVSNFLCFFFFLLIPTSTNSSFNFISSFAGS